MSFNYPQMCTSIYSNFLNCRTLSLGIAPDCWSVYRSAGPYLTQVGVEVDSRWIVVNTPVHIEILAKVQAAHNFSSGKISLFV